MKLYNQNIDKIINKKVVQIGEFNVIVSKTSEEVLNSGGYFYIVSKSPKSRRYYTNTQTKMLIGNKYTLDYISTPKNIADVQSLLIEDLFKASTIYENTAEVITSVGITVKGRPSDLAAFNIGGDRGLTVARDKYGIKYNISQADMITIATEIEDNGISLFNTKWDKYDEIQAFTTVDECILYEATPYIINEEIIDDIGVGTGEFHDVTYYKNNVKEW